MTTPGRDDSDDRRTARSPLAAAVLAGGASRRFGSDKATAVVAGQTMLDRTLETVRSTGCDPVMVLGEPPGGFKGAPMLADRLPGSGPLVAVVDALRWLGRGHLLVAPCDHPLLSAADLSLLVDVATASPLDTGVVAVSDGRRHPTLGCWPTLWGPSLYREVQRGERALRRLLEAGPIVEVELSASAVADADTPDELTTLLDEI